MNHYLLPNEIDWEVKKEDLDFYYPNAKIIYNRIGKKGSAFAWYAAKQKTKILIYEKKNKKAIKLLRKSFDNLPEKNI